MAEKHTTLAQLRINALRTKSEVLALLVDAFEGVQVGMTITLPANGWSGRAQTIQDARFLANNNYFYVVSPDPDSLSEASETGVKANNVTVNGQLTFNCEVTPESDLTIHILRLEVEIDEEEQT